MNLRLEGLAIVDSSQGFTLTLSDNTGMESIIEPDSSPLNFQGFPKLPSPSSGVAQHYLSNNNDNYWSELIPENNMLYVQFNNVVNKGSSSLEDFNLALRIQITDEEVDTWYWIYATTAAGMAHSRPP
jgi:hypothetical protein